MWATSRNGNGPASRTSVALTRQGRAALDTYTATLRQMLDVAVGFKRAGGVTSRPLAGKTLALIFDQETRP